MVNHEAASTDLGAALQIDKSRAEQRLAKAERWEDIGIGAGITREREEGMYDTMVGIGVSIPLRDIYQRVSLGQRPFPGA